jgi:DNA (cytosine-5)-methyltransferase 1
MRAIGITCGIGSMLVGAKEAGFEIVGNVEWRRYYHGTDLEDRNTFRENFPGSILKFTADDLTPAELKKFTGADIALGHPECGNFSQLGGVNKGAKEKFLDPTDIPLFIDLVAKLKPRFFVMDDLPRSFMAFPMKEYTKRLPDYDLFPEWISNWGYGNVQKHRDRMFMIGSLKKERWTFVPGEEDQPGLTLESVIGDMGKPGQSNLPNHYPWAPDELAQKSLSLRFLGDRPNWKELIEFGKENWKRGESMTYFANDGTIKRKPGCKIEHWDRGASVQDGGSYKIHPTRHEPLTLRERARIQGFPDDFIFYGAKLNERGQYNYDKNTHMAKQTGKAMPVQFCTYVSKQVAAHIEKKPFAPSGRRLLKANAFVGDAKQFYCREVGYANQKKACANCWLFKSCSIRSEKYGIGPTPLTPRKEREPVERQQIELKRKPLKKQRENLGIVAEGQRKLKHHSGKEAVRVKITGEKKPSRRFVEMASGHDLTFKRS